MAMRPQRMIKDELVAVLRDIVARVEIGDSFEGSITWTMPEDDDPHGFDVMGLYRIGNREGQGGVRMIGEAGED